MKLEKFIQLADSCLAGGIARQPTETKREIEARLLQQNTIALQVVGTAAVGVAIGRNGIDQRIELPYGVSQVAGLTVGVAQGEHRLGQSRAGLPFAFLYIQLHALDRPGIVLVQIGPPGATRKRFGVVLVLRVVGDDLGIESVGLRLTLGLLFLADLLILAGLLSLASQVEENLAGTGIRRAVLEVLVIHVEAHVRVAAFFVQLAQRDNCSRGNVTLGSKAFP